jgi:hypothetical protein
MMELDFRHSELFANPIHLLAVHLHKQYLNFGKTSTGDTFLLHLNSIYMILDAMARRTRYSAQIPGIARIMCRERVLCFLNHLRETDRRSRGLVWGLRCAHFSETHVLMLASKAFELEPRPHRVSSCTTAPLQREEYRLRLKRLPPICQGERFPPFKSSTARSWPALLRPRFLRPCRKRKLTFPFWKEKLRPAYFFSPKRNPRIPGEKGRKQSHMAQPKRRQPLQTEMFHTEHPVN